MSDPTLLRRLAPRRSRFAPWQLVAFCWFSVGFLLGGAGVRHDLQLQMEEWRTRAEEIEVLQRQVKSFVSPINNERQKWVRPRWGRKTP